MRHDSPAGDRALALSAGTVNLLQAIGVWQGVKSNATAINDIHISDQGHFGKSRLSAQKQGVDALGYVITARDIEDHVTELVEQANITQYCPAKIVGFMSGQDTVNVNIKQAEQSVNLTAKLLVGADGGQSSVRHLLEITQQKTDYQQTALVTTVKTSIAHQNRAFERFTASGPLAILPISRHECSVVWTRTTVEADELMTATDEQFIAQLQQCFGYHLGELSLTTPRRLFPLILIRADRMTQGRSVIIGNAVHQLHPVAGQGFNLGMRDVTQLAEMLIKQHQQQADIGDTFLLEQYADSRQQDHNQTISFTDNIVKIFSTDWLPLAAGRSISLAIMDHLPFAKSILTQHAMGLAGRLPRVGSRQ